jgi:hypothetical protein
MFEGGGPGADPVTIDNRYSIFSLARNALGGKRDQCGFGAKSERFGC